MRGLLVFPLKLTEGPIPYDFALDVLIALYALNRFSHRLRLSSESNKKTDDSSIDQM